MSRFVLRGPGLDWTRREHAIADRLGPDGSHRRRPAQSPAAARAAAYLRDTQCRDGSWEETRYTGTGFPKDFYIGYRLYAQVFPIWALGRYRQALQPS